MKNLCLSLLVICFFSCNKNILDQAPDNSGELIKNIEITIDGDQRLYHLYVPPQVNNAPLVVLLHGHGGSHNQIIGLNRTKAPFKIWLDIASEENIIIAVPNGVIGPDDSRGWNDGRSDGVMNPVTDDVKFISSMIDEISNKYNVNQKMVYVNGISNGGHMTYRLAEAIPHKLAAVASIVASRPKHRSYNDSEIPLSILIMNGTGDDFIPYEGGNIIANRGEVLSTEATVNYWINKNKTNSTPLVEKFKDTDDGDKSTVEKYSYLKGQQGREVVLYKVIGGGHTEPSIKQRYGKIYKAIVGTQNGDIEMADEVWEFFKGKELR